VVAFDCLYFQAASVQSSKFTVWAVWVIDNYQYQFSGRCRYLLFSFSIRQRLSPKVYTTPSSSIAQCNNYFPIPRTCVTTIFGCPSCSDLQNTNAVLVNDFDHEVWLRNQETRVELLNAFLYHSKSLFLRRPLLKS